MKLKFRAEGKDVAIFCAFALVWLLLVALAVVNVAAFIGFDEAKKAGNYSATLKAKLAF